MNPKTLRTTVIILAILLIGSVFYNIHQASQLKNQGDTIGDVQTEKKLLTQEVDSLEMELNDLMELNVERDSTLQATYAELDSKKSELRALLNKSDLSEKEVRQLRQEVNRLKSQVSSYKSQIQKLQKENEGLRLANDTLNIENLQVRDSLQQVSGEYTAVSEKYQKTEELVNNTLSVSNFNITPLKVRNSGKEVEKTKARRVDKLKVDFKLDPNPKASSGSKTLYISIFKPDGSLAKFDSASPGSFTDKDGRTVKYSDKITVPYNNNSGAPVQFDWDHKDFSPGTYKINIYQNGFKIGQEEQTLKL